MRNLDPLNVRVIVTDAGVLSRLNPDAVAAYLARTGWTWTGRGPRPGTVWALELDRSGAAAVFLPNDQTYADFAIRMGELLTVLARVEDRSQLAVLVDLYAGETDAGSPGASP